MILIAVFFSVVFGQRFCLDASLYITLGWIFVNPLMILAICNIWTINNNLDYRHVQNVLQIMFGILAGLLYISTGVFAFNQD